MSSRLTIIIEFNRPLTDKDVACIGLGGIYFKTDKSKIGFDYMRVVKTKIGDRWIRFELCDDDVKTFPEMTRLQEVLTEDGLEVEELNVEYDPMDIEPVYPAKIDTFAFDFLSKSQDFSNGAVLIHQKTTIALRYKHCEKLYEQWNRNKEKLAREEKA